MNVNKLDNLIRREAHLVQKLDKTRQKLKRQIERAQKLYDFLTGIHAGKRSSVRNRALVHDNRYTKVLTNLLKSI